MKGIFKKVLSLLLVISMLMGMMTTVVYSIEEKTITNWLGDNVALDVEVGTEGYTYMTAVYKPTADAKKNYYYYETSNHTIKKEVTGGGAVHLLTMVDTLQQNGKNFTWTPDGIYKACESNYDVLYCCDAATASEGGVYFKRLNLEDSEYYSEQQAKQIRAILTNSYPYVSLDEMKEYLKEMGFEQADQLDRSEVISAVQAAVWSVSNFNSGDSYDYNKTATTAQKLTWGGYIHDYSPEITSFTDSTTSRKYITIAEVGARINALKAFLLSLDPTEADDNQIVITSLDIVNSKVYDMINKYDITLNVELNHGADENDDVILHVYVGDQLVATKSVNDATTYSVQVEAKENDNIKVIVSGTQELEKGVYFYAPKPADVDGDGIATSREVAQNMVGVSSGKTPVHAEANIVVREGELAIRGEKTWNDADNQDGIRPESITINLLANGEKVAEIVVKADENGNWKYLFENLPLYKNDEKVVYTIVEDAVDGYNTTYDRYNIINTHEPEKITISGAKIWDDNNDQDGIRPDSITINLYANGEFVKSATVTADNEWTFTFENLPKNRAGKEIEYTITEVTVEGYETEIDGFNVTNTHIPETVKVSGEKTWNDNNNQDGVRPESITINLLANGKEIKDVKVTADKNGNWTYSFENLPKYENGKEITYTITEDEVEGYTTTIDGFNVTNTYTPETITVSGNKIWNDKNDQDGIRPESITINLLANGKVVDSVVVTAKDGWAWSFENLDKFAAGEEITYTITEDAVEGYTTTINGFNVTNTHIPETIKVSGNKTWNDNNNQDGIRPESITINLLANGKVVDSVVVTAKDGWAWSFENLDKFAAGEEITYTITEDAVEGYTTAIDGFNVTNTHIPETIKVSGNKTWNDKNNQDGIRPESITINLLANGKVVDSVVVTAKDGWAWSFENLDKFAAGKEITYTITEDAVEGYTTTIDGFNVTNTHIPETIKVSGNKTWNDANNQDGKRPESITINLLANGKEIKDVKVTADKNGNWTYSFENLPKYENGKEITYTITEDEVEGYTTAIDGFNVTNTHIPETIKVSGNKTWNDANNQDGKRPESITINLLANGKEIKDVKVTADKNGNWTYSFENLPKYENGKEITYTITEDEVEGYTTTIDGFNVTNTHIPETIKVSGNKTWNDKNNQDGIRPESITINLLANGKVVDSVVVTAKDGWTWSFENLDKFAAGEEITYTITENKVSGYTTEIDGFNVTNTHIPETIKVSGNKTWNDKNNQDGIRPESITINLLANGKVVDSVVVTAKDGWAWSFENLDKFAAGKEITYTITEDAVEGYTTTIDGFNVTNTHIPETIKVSGNKTWNDKNNQDGIRPESITINLLANGKVVDSVVVTAKDGWAWSFENLDKFAAGKEITYTITEDAVEGYTTTIDGFNVTNTHIPETIKVSGNKTWNDKNNQDGIRPESITINLLANGKVVDSVVVTAKDGWAWSFENLDKFAAGKEITYTITENKVSGYTTEIDGFNVTNTHIPETVKVSGNKTWVDKNNQDGKRPASITINLLANGKVVDSVVVTAKDGWAWSFEDLDKFAAGEEIVYSITEDTVKDYSTTYNGFNVTNTYVPETTAVSGIKTWNDNNNQDGIRPESITINLLANGKVVDSVVVTAENGWAWNFANLDKFAAGAEIVYSIEEVAVEGYTTTYEGFNVINTHIPETTEVSGNKTWNDNNNQDGIRPESITINLLANGKVVDSVVVTAEDGWAWNFANLDKFAAGAEIVYSIEEVAVEGYTTTYEGFNVINTHVPETIAVSGNKTWNDNNNQDGIRPKSITINLLANGKVVDSVVVTAEDGWAWNFANLDKFAAGAEIVYSIEEVAVEGYTTTYEGFNVINTHVPETIAVSGNKTWNDNNNQDGIRPESITINLLANGKVVDSVVVTAEDGWSWSFANLDKFAAGAEIVYSIEEVAVEGYTTTYEGFNVINTHVPETKLDLSGIKYLDGEAAEGFTFVLVDAEGNVIGTVESGADGKFAFATLVYTEEGTHVYFIKEVVGDDEDIIYDTSVYMATVTVTKEGEELKASCVLAKDEVSHEGAIEFYNETIVEIPDNPPPLDDVPQTGDNNVANVFIIAGMVVALGVIIKSKRRRFE